MATSTESISANGKCEIKFKPGPGRSNDNQGSRTDWAGASVSFVGVQTIFLDVDKRELYRFTDVNGNDAIDSDEATLLADNVYDFQIALGYDFRPADRIVEDRGDDTDEWLNNFLGESLGAGSFANARRNQLRIVKIGIVVGAKAPQDLIDRQEPIKVFDGPTRNDGQVYLKAITSTMLLRNMQKY